MVEKDLTNLPGFAEVIRTLNQHSCGTKGFEGDDQMSEMKLSFQIQSDGDIFHTVF